MDGLEIREFRSNDLEEAAKLVQSFWELNTEFEPSIGLEENALELIKKDLQKTLERQDLIVLVARTDLALVGVIRVELKEGNFRAPKRWGNIVEFYVLPRARRKSVAKGLLDETLIRLGQKDIEIVTAEFPSQNIPAASFYERNGFRSIQTVCAKNLT
jgi:ribosomal protein S18 acetylase RimI-like enzyme